MDLEVHWQLQVLTTRSRLSPLDSLVFPCCHLSPQFVSYEKASEFKLRSSSAVRAACLKWVVKLFIRLLLFQCCRTLFSHVLSPPLTRPLSLSLSVVLVFRFVAAGVVLWRAFLQRFFFQRCFWFASSSLFDDIFMCFFSDATVLF